MSSIKNVDKKTNPFVKGFKNSTQVEIGPTHNRICRTPLPCPRIRPLALYYYCYYCYFYYWHYYLFMIWFKHRTKTRSKQNGKRHCKVTLWFYDGRTCQQQNIISQSTQQLQISNKKYALVLRLLIKGKKNENIAQNIHKNIYKQRRRWTIYWKTQKSKKFYSIFSILSDVLESGKI